MTVILPKGIDLVVVERHITTEGVQIVVKLRASDVWIAKMKITPGELELWSEQIRLLKVDDLGMARQLEILDQTTTSEKRQ